MKNKFLTESDILGQAQNANSKQSSVASNLNPTIRLETLDDLLKRDAQRKKDGFSKKIKIGKIPSTGGGIIFVPTAEEEKLYHGKSESDSDDESKAGHGEGEEGEIIGEQPLDEENEEGNQPGGNTPGEHGVEADVFNFGAELAKELELPNLKDKNKKIPTEEYVYDLTDRFVGRGQLLDKKATVRRVVKTNYALGLFNPENIDTTKLLVCQKNKVYRVLSKETVYKSQAVVFFLRDYSGSMTGQPTKAIVSQHLMIFSLLYFRYKRLAIPRFILHDTEAKEVPDFNAYYNMRVSGGTMISSAYQLVNKIVSEENLERDYNIFVFHGTDGDDYDSSGEEMLQELSQIMTYASRVGISIAKNRYTGDETLLETNLIKSDLLKNRDIIRLFARSANKLTDEQNKAAVKEMLSP